MAGQRAPGWFVRALASAPARRHVEVEGCAIRYLRWGDPRAAGVVLVHGGAAHAHWWSFIAPLVAASHHVVALDLSGHGDSDRRPAYSPELWAEEVVAVARHAGMSEPVLVGHSMGGFVSIVAAAQDGDDLAGVVIVDSPVRRPDPESEEARGGRMFRQPKSYASLEEAMQHFVLVPPQPCENDFIIQHVARHSLHETGSGWTWKFDPAVFQRFTSRIFGDYLADARCRVAVFHGERSDIVTDDITEYMNELLGRNAPFVEIPASYHHLILDQPLAFVAALRAILADWEHTIPRTKLGV